MIDESVIDDYLTLRGLTSLTKGKYEIVVLDNTPAKETSKELENLKANEGFDDSLRFKKISDLSDNELNELIDYYDSLDLTSIHKKARKGYIDKVAELNELKNIREVKTAPNKS